MRMGRPLCWPRSQKWPYFSYPPMFSDLKRGTGASVIASAGALQFALESDKLSNGVFTHALLMGLGGVADRDSDQHLQFSELRDYVARSVRELTDGMQTPAVRQENLDDDFAIY